MDIALPIGYGQTNSQPYTVRLMFDWLDPQPGDVALDVGSGSGWTTALLAYLLGPRGHVHAMEIVPDLVEFGQHNCERHGITNVTFHQASEGYGLPEYAPFDRILVSASAQNVPEELKNELKPGGKLVIPVGHDILEISKTPDGHYPTKIHSGFIFVPLL